MLIINQMIFRHNLLEYIQVVIFSDWEHSVSHVARIIEIHIRDILGLNIYSIIVGSMKVFNLYTWIDHDTFKT